MVRAPGIAPGTADWQTATLLLRHARTVKLGPCRTRATGWLQGDPIGQSGLRPRIENRRFLKETIDQHRGTLARWRLSPPSPSLRQDAHERERSRAKLAALAGLAPASRGLKDRDPGLLDDKAEK